MKEKLSPYYNINRIPRKLKKKVKKFCGIHWYNLDNNQRMWYCLETKPKYKWRIILKICEKYK
jgi:hypothetical protein